MRVVKVQIWGSPKLKDWHEVSGMNRGVDSRHMLHQRAAVKGHYSNDRL